jgi:peptidoglycan hydrolase-like protein with peptidoglycan-binding domain
MATLSIGKSGRAVRKIQEFLNKLGYGLNASGEFDAATETAVKDFQSMNGIDATGFVDRSTKSAIKRAAKSSDAPRKRPAERTVAALIELVTPHLDEPDIDEDFLKPISATDRNNIYGSKKFGTFSEAFAFYQTLQSMEIPADKKPSVLADFKRFAILSIIGSAPSVSEIEKIKATLAKETWLLPEGEDVYMNYYIKDSPNWFTETVRANGAMYFCTVKRKDAASFSLDIKVVRNGASNMSYSGTIGVSKNDTSITASIFKSELKGYAWAEDRASALAATLEKGKNVISLKSVGAMSTFHAGTHTNNKAQDAEFSEQNCIEAALNCFVVEYNKILK